MTAPPSTSPAPASPARSTTGPVDGGPPSPGPAAGPEVGGIRPTPGGRPATGAAVGQAVAAGIAVAAGSSALSGVLRGHDWFWSVLAAVGTVVAIGLVVRLAGTVSARSRSAGAGSAGAGSAGPRGTATRRWVWASVVAGVQLVGLALLLIALFGTEATPGVLPAPGPLAQLFHQLTTATGQLEGGTPPVATTAALRLLACLGFGLLAVAVDAAAAFGQAPAACGLVLLGAYTVPTALAPRALPDWSLTAGALGYGLVLLTTHQARRIGRRIVPHPTAADPGPSTARSVLGRAAVIGEGTPLAVLLVVLALAAGLGAGLLAPIGTEGRLAGSGHGDNGATDGQFGLNPFTSLRGQLDSDAPVELLRVRGLPSEQYLRALTLNRYVPQQGWALPDRLNGVTLDGSLPSGMAQPVNNPTATVSVQNVGYLDQWLPLFGQPMGVTGVVSGRWHFDVLSGTAYTDTPVHEPSWTERTGLPDPSIGDLEHSPPATDVSPTYLDSGGVDPRITEIAKGVTRSAHSPYERTVALNRYFLDPAFGFRYSLRTRPGNSGDALVDFLTRGKAGYCEQFASAMAVMLRTVGVPARVAVGFSSGKPVGDYRSIGTGDAHAWVEAFFTGIGWLPFDPTPLNDGRTVLPSYVSQGPKIDIKPPPSPASNGTPAPGDTPDRPDAPPPPDQRSEPGPSGSTPAPPPPVPGAGQPQGAGAAPGGTPAAPDDRGDGPGSGADGAAGPGGSTPGGEDSDDGSSDPAGGSGIPGWLIGGTVAALLALLAVLLGPAAARGGIRRYRLAQAERGGPDGAWAAWREVLAEFRDQGVRPEENVTLRAAARGLVRDRPVGDAGLAGLKTVIHSLERGWYGGNAQGGGPELVRAVGAVAGGLRASSPLPVRARLWPRSVLPGRGVPSAAGRRLGRKARELIGSSPG